MALQDGGGALEEILLHEGSHLTIDKLLYKTTAWRCAQLQDQNYISSYAKGKQDTEDIAESLVAWHAWYFKRGDAATIATINSAIPARLKVLTSFLTSASLKQDLVVMQKEQKFQKVQKARPHIIRENWQKL